MSGTQIDDRTGLPILMITDAEFEMLGRKDGSFRQSYPAGDMQMPVAAKYLAVASNGRRMEVDKTAEPSRGDAPVQFVRFTFAATAG